MDKGFLISVVDDDPGLREALSDLLRAAGYNATAFGSAEAFLDSEERRRCGCVVADIHMDGLSGIDLTKRVAAAHDAPKVVLITGHPEDIWRERAMSSGAVGFLRKPIVAEQLLDLIGRSLAR